MILIVSPEEWTRIRKQPDLLDRLRFMNPTLEPAQLIAELILSYLPEGLTRAVDDELKVVVDYGGLNSAPGRLRAPETPGILPSRRLSREARTRWLDQAQAERLAAGMRTFATAWQEDGSVVLEVTTEDGQLWNRGHLADDVVAEAHEAALEYMTQVTFEELKIAAGDLIRKRLGYPAHLG